MQQKGQNDAVPSILGRKTAAPGVKQASNLRGRKGSPDARHKLLTTSWEMDTSTLNEVLTDNKDFFVVGVLGGCGTGKSTLLNELLGVQAPADAKGSKGAVSGFPVQSAEKVSKAVHCSEGLDVVVSSDRIIAIDSQPLFAPSLLLDALKGDRPPPGLAGSAASAVGDTRGALLSGEGLQHMVALQLGVLLFTVCHLVVVLIPPGCESRYWEWLIDVDLLLHSIPDISLPASALAGSAGGHTPSLPEHVAQLVVVHTRMPPRDCEPWRVLRLRTALNAILETSRFSKPGWLVYAPCVCCGTDDTPGPALAVHSTAPTPSVANGSTSAGAGSADGGTATEKKGEANFWIVPERCRECGGQEGQQCSSCQRHPAGGYKYMLDGLVQQLLDLPRSHFARPVSEGEWLKGCERAWDTIRRSHEIGDFYARLQRTLYKGAGGHAMAR